MQRIIALFGKLKIVALFFAASYPAKSQAQTWQFYQGPTSGTNPAHQTSFEDIDGPVFVGRQIDQVGGANRGVVYNSSTGSWSEIHKEDAYATIIYSKSGNTLVGEYENLVQNEEVVEGVTNTYTTSTFHGFLSTDGGATLNTFNISGAAPSSSSILYDTRGTKFIGTYYSNAVTSPNWFYFNQRTHEGGRGFVHDLADGTTRTFAISNAITTQATSVVRGASNTVVVGTAYFEIGGALSSKAFIYDLDNQTETLLDFPDAEYTTFFAGDNGRFVGAYRDEDLLADDPLGILGPGYKIRGLLYEQASNTWTSLEAPHPVDPSLGVWSDTWANSIQGDTIVGTAQYFNLAGQPGVDPDDGINWSIQAFVYTVPEPSSVGLLGAGLVGLWMMRRRRG